MNLRMKTDIYLSLQNAMNQKINNKSHQNWDPFQNEPYHL